MQDWAPGVRAALKIAQEFKGTVWSEPRRNVTIRSGIGFEGWGIIVSRNEVRSSAGMKIVDCR